MEFVKESDESIDKIAADAVQVAVKTLESSNTAKAATLQLVSDDGSRYSIEIKKISAEDLN